MTGLGKQEIFPVRLTRKQLSDAGMALVLILLLVGVFTGNDLWYKLAIPVLLLNMAIPGLFKPFAWFWYSLSNLLGFVVSRVLMTIIYIILVVPISVIRKLMGKDNLDLRKFKKGSGSVMKVRNYMYSGKDLLRPY